MRDNLFGKSFSYLSSMIQEYCSLNLKTDYVPEDREVCLGQFPGIQKFIFIFVLYVFILLMKSYIYYNFRWLMVQSND